MTPTATVRVPLESATAFRQFWKEIRTAEGLDASLDLLDPEEMDRFDAAALAEWIIPLTQYGSAILSAVLGYLVARRGEIEIGDKKFRNVSIADVKEILKILEPDRNADAG
jgi:hypothetical protein